MIQPLCYDIKIIAVNVFGNSEPASTVMCSLDIPFNVQIDYVVNNKDGYLISWNITESFDYKYNIEIMYENDTLYYEYKNIKTNPLQVQIPSNNNEFRAKSHIRSQYSNYYNSSFSEWSNVIDIIDVPPNPYDVVAVSIEDKGVNLTWKCDCMNCKYYIHIYDVKTNIKSYYTIMNDKLTMITGLIYNEVYKMSVIATNNHGNSSEIFSNEILYPKGPPSIPINLNCQSLNDDSLSLRWLLSNNNGYEITNCDVYLLDEENDEYYIVNNTQNSNSFIDIIDLEGNKTYYVSVECQNNVGFSGKSNPVECKTKIPKPSEIYNVITTSGYTWINIEWSIDSYYGNIHYIICWKNAQLDNEMICNNDNSNSNKYYNITGLLSGYYYNIRITAVDQYGEVSKDINNVKTRIFEVKLVYEPNYNKFDVNDDLMINPKEIEITTNNYNLSFSPLDYLPGDISFSYINGSIYGKSSSSYLHSHIIKLSTIQSVLSQSIILHILKEIILQYKIAYIFTPGYVYINPKYIKNAPFYDYTINPPLPSCLSFNQSNGIIEGNCNEIMAYEKYTIVVFTNTSEMNITNFGFEIISLGLPYYIYSNLNDLVLRENSTEILRFELYNRNFTLINSEYEPIESRFIISYDNSSVNKEYTNIKSNNGIIEFPIYFDNSTFSCSMKLIMNIRSIGNIEYNIYNKTILPLINKDKCKIIDKNEECCDGKLDICGKCNGNNDECEMKMKLKIEGNLKDEIISNEDEYREKLNPIINSIMNNQSLLLSDGLIISNNSLSINIFEIPHISFILSFSLLKSNNNRLLAESLNELYDVSLRDKSINRISDYLSQELNRIYENITVEISQPIRILPLDPSVIPTVNPTTNTPTPGETGGNKSEGLSSTGKGLIAFFVIVFFIIMLLLLLFYLKKYHNLDLSCNRNYNSVYRYDNGIDGHYYDGSVIKEGDLQIYTPKPNYGQGPYKLIHCRLTTRGYLDFPGSIPGAINLNNVNEVRSYFSHDEPFAFQIWMKSNHSDLLLREYIYDYSYYKFQAFSKETALEWIRVLNEKRISLMKTTKPHIHHLSKV